MKIQNQLIFLPFLFSLESSNLNLNISNEIPIRQVENTISRKDVSVNEFESLMKKEAITILDVRTPEEWQNGIILGAKKINFGDSDFLSQLEHLDKSKEVLVYCHSGGRSSETAKDLVKMGFKVYNLDGGISAWKDAGKSIVK
jgi:rhodanese-related sulfurtransferase